MIRLSIDEVTMSGLAGSNVRDGIVEAFDWFYTGNGRDAEKLTLRHINGVKVTFEREEK